MSTIEQRTQKFTQDLFKKQSKIWYEEWNENWVLWVVMLLFVLFVLFWILSYQELPDICFIQSDSEEEDEELEEESGNLYEETCTVDDLKLELPVEPLLSELPTVKPRRFGSIGEQITCETLESVYNVPFPTVRPNFLKNPETKRNLELDCYNEDLKIAAEYNGKQHYTFPNYFHKTRQDFLKQVRRDRLKAEICELRNIHLISIPWTVPRNRIADYVKYYLPENIKARKLGLIEPIRHNWAGDLVEPEVTVDISPICLDI